MIRIYTVSYQILGQNTDCHPKNVACLLMSFDIRLDFSCIDLRENNSDLLANYKQRLEEAWDNKGSAAGFTCIMIIRHCLPCCQHCMFVYIEGQFVL